MFCVICSFPFGFLLFWDKKIHLSNDDENHFLLLIFFVVVEIERNDDCLRGIIPVPIS